MRSQVRALASPSGTIASVWSNCRRALSSLVSTKIDDKTRDHFSNIFAEESADPYRNYLDVQKKSGEVLREILPRTTQEVLREFGSKGRSLILLQNSPVVGEKGLPPTPSSSKRPEDKDFVSECFMLGVADLIRAEPFLVSSVRDGSVINQIIPTDPKSISGSGSKIEFGLHNELVHEKITPDFFLLLCLRGNPLAKTNYCFLADIVKFLPREVIEELQKPNFLMRSGDKSVFKEAKELRRPILTKDKDGNFEVRLNTAPGRCEGLTDEAKFALSYVSNCLRASVPMHSVVLSRGDVLLVEDKKLLHGRGAFDPEIGVEEVEIDGLKRKETRWVQRMNLSRSEDQKSRVI